MGYYLPPLPLLGCCVVSFDLYWQDNFLNNKIQSDKDNFLDNLIYEIAIMGVLGSIFRQDNFLTIYERFWHLGGHVVCLSADLMCAGLVSECPRATAEEPTVQGGGQ